MEKEMGNIKVTETDDGYRIDIKGKDIKKIMPICVPVSASCDDKDGGCCVKIVKADKNSDCC